jgi:hypothetical protein
MISYKMFLYTPRSEVEAPTKLLNDSGIYSLCHTMEVTLFDVLLSKTC